MTIQTPTPLGGRPAGCSDAEWEARQELAAIYNALVKYRLTDVTNQWHALRVPGEDALLTHHYGWMHEEVTASNLIKVGFDRTNHTPRNGEPNPSATEIGKLFFEADPEMNCIMHVHTKAIMGVSAQAEGVGPYSQAYLMIGGGDVIGYTDYEFECTEDFLCGLLRAGQGRKMIVEAWHGAFVFGRNAGEAFFRSFYLDQACAVQLEVQKSAAGGATIRTIPEAEQRRHLADMAASDWYGYEGELEWHAIRRRLDAEMPHYRG
ncbi:class II aldolase/adducin family protein [Roseibacterium sp. SDUM158016]|jgi:ribulose-5-phosphate 4-epimerase/fuculose-1-phosphate aldolase|uniref:class II aldolase/adducin family protein n=1 Tax=Roseicyclus sediminis TaxID=2980997 RepID=UPI0021D3DF12|nr:class II aldolase/adducin family protein [Roseibacterium sp. SDUM158016]MCU4653228.1 class II aldolase/adducin family protein [Roseibacterium sp. SDUM158016]